MMFCDFQAAGDHLQCARCQTEVRAEPGVVVRMRCSRGVIANTVDSSMPQRFSSTACEHQGAETRSVPCGLCGQRDVSVSVYQCAVHGECTRRFARPRGEPKLVCCLSCRDYQAAT